MNGKEDRYFHAQMRSVWSGSNMLGIQNYCDDHPILTNKNKSILFSCLKLFNQAHPHLYRKDTIMVDLDEILLELYLDN